MFAIPAVDRAANTMEYFIHHEDVRRAQPDAEPRDLDPRFADELWNVVRRMSKLMLRKAPAGVTLVLASGGESAERVMAHKGDPMVRVTGAAGELALFVYGRQDHARVELDGPDDSVHAVRTASFGV